MRRLLLLPLRRPVRDADGAAEQHVEPLPAAVRVGAAEAGAQHGRLQAQQRPRVEQLREVRPAGRPQQRHDRRRVGAVEVEAAAAVLGVVLEQAVLEQPAEGVLQAGERAARRRRAPQEAHLDGEGELVEEEGEGRRGAGAVPPQHGEQLVRGAGAVEARRLRRRRRGRAGGGLGGGPEGDGADDADALRAEGLRGEHLPREDVQLLRAGAAHLERREDPEDGAHLRVREVRAEVEQPAHEDGVAGEPGRVRGRDAREREQGRVAGGRAAGAAVRRERRDELAALEGLAEAAEGGRVGLHAGRAGARVAGAEQRAAEREERVEEHLERVRSVGGVDRLREGALRELAPRELAAQQAQRAAGVLRHAVEYEQQQRVRGHEVVRRRF